jgi:Dual specificity phosphatase, catalytic domain
VSAKYGVAFLLLAGAASFASWAAGPGLVRLAAGWSALSFGLLSAAYAGLGPGLLLKRPDGGRWPAVWLLHGPYFLLNELGFRLYRVAERRPPFDVVAPGLFLGRRLTAREARRAGLPAWSAVLDLAAEFPEVGPLRRAGAYRSIPILDASAPRPGELASAVAWLSERLTSGPVLVHCALGHGRSATVAVAYLMASGRAPTVEAGIAQVTASRPGVRLNPPQVEALRRFARASAGGAP